MGVFLKWKKNIYNRFVSVTQIRVTAERKFIESLTIEKTMVSLNAEEKSVMETLNVEKKSLELLDFCERK